jgi:hypothetical protein
LALDTDNSKLSGSSRAPRGTIQMSRTCSWT